LIDAAAFLGRAAALAARIPASAAIVNVCTGRLGFITGFAAALLLGRPTLLPPNRLPATLAGLQYEGEVVLLDDTETPVPGAIRVSEITDWSPWRGAVPTIADDHPVVVAFTSGSTGSPVPCAKTWRSLTAVADWSATTLGVISGVRIVGTVPAHHLFGLETTVMPALRSGAVVDTAQPRFAEDLIEAIGDDGPRTILMTTPMHLELFVSAGISPKLRSAISATAPLSREHALAAERAFEAPVNEIYGCTEAGSIAHRRVVADPRWTPNPAVRFERTADGTRVIADYLPGEVLLADTLDIEPDGRFSLLGRNADLVKIGGQRVSLAELTQRLKAIDGVEDGVMFLPDRPGRTGRIAALVVAPGLSENQLMTALTAHIDAIFLPRPLRKVAQLPRNELGKLPHQLLIDLLK
jgi:acyl-coenzyme A synthetase/AMP-(fatty) acid ligase